MLKSASGSGPAPFIPALRQPSPGQGRPWAALLGSTGLGLFLSLAAGASLAGEIRATGGAQGLGTRVNGVIGGACGKGACAVSGGTGAADNLFHRFRDFDTRGGITGVSIDSGSFRNVMVGVTNPLGSFIDKAVSLSGRANLVWLSPGGIHLSGAGGFRNVQQLTLTTATGLRIGTGLFDAAATTAAQASQLVGTPWPGRSGLVSDPATLRGLGLTVEGDLAIEGGLLTVENGLLLDAQGGNVLLDGARLEVPGGSVDLHGRDVQLGNSRVDVSAPAGAGGSVALSGERIALAGSSISADALGRGDGGRVVLNGRESARIDGWLSARGGPEGGDGGFVETSGGFLALARGPDLAAPAGKGGTWLIDPRNIEIVAFPRPTPGRSGRAAAAADPEAPTRIDVRTINSVLDAGGSVTLDTSDPAYNPEGFDQEGSISVLAPIRKSGGEHSSLNLFADAGITIDVRGEAFSNSSGAGLDVHLLYDKGSQSGAPWVFWRNGAIDLGSGTMTVSSGPSRDPGLLRLGTQGADLEFRSGTLRTGDLLLPSAAPSRRTLRLGRSDAAGPARVEVSGLYQQGAGWRVEGFETAELRLLSGAAGSVADGSFRGAGSAAGPVLDVASQASLNLNRVTMDGFRLRVASGGSATVADGGVPHTNRISALENDGTLLILPGVDLAVGRLQNGSSGQIALIGAEPGSGRTTALDITDSVSLLNSGLIRGAGTVSVAGGEGGFENGATGTLTPVGSLAIRSASFLNAGTISAAGGPGSDILEVGAAAAGNEGSISGSLAIRVAGGQGSFLNAGGGRIEPEGTVSIESAAFLNQGLITGTAPSDRLAVAAPQLRNEGLIGGSPSIDVAGGAGTFENAAGGRIEPVGPLAIGAAGFAVRQGSGLAFELSRGDQLRVSGEVRLDGGALQVSSLQAFDPGVSFDLVLGRSMAGAFGAVTLPGGFRDEGIVPSLDPVLPAAYQVKRVAPPPEPPPPEPPPSPPSVQPEPPPRPPQSAAPPPATPPFVPPVFPVNAGLRQDVSLRQLSDLTVSLNQADFLEQEWIRRCRPTRRAGTRTARPSVPLAQRPRASSDALVQGVSALDAAQLASAWAEDDQERRDDVQQCLVTLETSAGTTRSLSLEDLQRHLNEASAATQRTRAAYNPAVLMISFHEGEPATAKGPPPDEVYLELTLIPREGEPVGRRVDLSRQRFAALLRQFYRQLARQEPLDVDNPAAPARQLEEALIGPLAPLLASKGITTLLLVPDRELLAVPFSALHDGSRFFGERFAFSISPALGLTSMEPPLRDRGKLLAVGASEFVGLSPLPLVPSELAGIPEGAGVDRYLNREFTPSVLLDRPADSRYQRIHVATHAEFRPGGASQARIYTGTGPVSLQDFVKLREQRSGAPLDLFVLSACRTALGDSESELGFAGLALQAGSRSAVGTLWYVDDVATSAYFLQLYRFLDQGMPKAEALQATREAMARGLVRLEGDRILGVDGTPLISGLKSAQERRVAAGMQHPYFWAGVMLLGSPW